MEWTLNWYVNNESVHWDDDIWTVYSTPTYRYEAMENNIHKLMWNIYINIK